MESLEESNENNWRLENVIWEDKLKELGLVYFEREDGPGDLMIIFKYKMGCIVMKKMVIKLFSVSERNRTSNDGLQLQQS